MPGAAGINGLGPAAGLGPLPPLALPLGAIAYVPAFIPVPQPVLTAIPNHSLQQYAQQVAAAQQGAAAHAGDGQQQPGQPGQGPFMQVGLLVLGWKGQLGSLPRVTSLGFFGPHCKICFQVVMATALRQFWPLAHLMPSRLGLYMHQPSMELESRWIPCC